MPGFLHNAENICVRDCDEIQYASGPSLQGNDYCTCNRNYFFYKDDADPYNAKCKLDCSSDVNIYNDGYLAGSGEKKCKCKADTIFDLSEKLCTPACTKDDLSTN